MSQKTIKVLIIDDEDNFRRLTSNLLSKLGFAVTGAPGGRQALELAKNNSFDVVLLDLTMPEMGGLEVLSRLKKLDSIIEVVVLTGQATVDSALDAMKLGAYDYLRKPVKIKELEIVLKKGYEKRKISLENNLLRDELSKFSGCCGIVGKSEQAKDIRSFILMAANSCSPVLVLGESGTGKELVARGIYHHNDLPGKWVAINGGGGPDELLASELFGHARGAFTGANEDKKGLVAFAKDGILFIDEIGEMSLHNQVSLLRFLEEGVYRPLGSSREVKVNVRIVAATNRNLEQEVQTGKFREDLYYRLNVLSIELPPLRERKEDIPELTACFLSQLNKKYKTSKSVVPTAIEKFMEHNWPGNVRELCNAVSRGFAVSRADKITSFDLSHQNRRSPHVPQHLQPLKTERLESIENVERRHLEKVLTHTKWNKAQAIRILGITYPRLQRLVTKYNLKREM